MYVQLSTSNKNQKIACKKQLFITEYIIGTIHIDDFEKLTFLKVKKKKKEKEKSIIDWQKGCTWPQ